MSGAPHLTLLIPGLLARLPGVESMAVEEWPALDALKDLLRYGRSGAAPAKGLEGALAARFGLAPDAPVPVAALTRLLDGGAGAEAGDDEAVWLRADPVYLQADRDSLRLLDAAPELTETEAQALAQHVNAHFAEEGWQIEALTPNRWYVRWSAPPQLHTVAPQRLLGQNVDPQLPREREWHRRLNEIQMCLHLAPTNAEREALGRLPVNSLWFWGEGRLPSVQADYSKVWSNEPLARALAQGAGIVQQSCSMAWPGEVLSQLGPNDLLVLDIVQGAQAQGDLFGWVDTVTAVDRQWLGPLWARVREGKLTLTLDAGDGRMWSVSRPKLWQRLPRPRRPLLKYLIEAQP